MGVLFAEKTLIKDKKTKTLTVKSDSCGFSSPSDDRESGLQVLAIGHVAVVSRCDPEKTDLGGRASLIPPSHSICRIVTSASRTCGYICPWSMWPDGIFPTHGPATGTTSVWILISKPTARWRNQAGQTQLPGIWLYRQISRPARQICVNAH